ncbi:hypothetical protein LLS1_01480 [Leifsonia sp. LS1]|nr:hypothetical protein LLS1_01480 [Leifsonia sp. LS1]
MAHRGRRPESARPHHRELPSVLKGTERGRAREQGGQRARLCLGITGKITAPRREKDYADVVTAALYMIIHRHLDDFEKMRVRDMALELVGHAPELTPVLEGI